MLRDTDCRMVIGIPRAQITYQVRADVAAWDVQLHRVWGRSENNSRWGSVRRWQFGLQLLAELISTVPRLPCNVATPATLIGLAVAVGTLFTDPLPFDRFTPICTRRSPIIHSTHRVLKTFQCRERTEDGADHEGRALGSMQHKCEAESPFE